MLWLEVHSTPISGNTLEVATCNKWLDIGEVEGFCAIVYVVLGSHSI